MEKKNEIKKPLNLDEMLQLAEILCKGYSHIRVDLFDVDNNIYFGELTFFDGSGFDKIEPKSFDELLGSWIKLPSNNID